MNKKNTYLTVLSSDDYLKGVLALNETLKATGTLVPFSVLVTGAASEYSEKLIQKYGISTIRLNRTIDLPEEVKRQNVSKDYSHWNSTLDKLFVFELMQFDKIVYLDSDMMVLENIDHLFDKPHMSAVVAAGKVPGNESWKGLNSGLLVIVPEKDIVEKLIKTIPQVVSKKENVGDQDILQSYFQDWTGNADLKLDDKYNLFFSSIHDYVELGYKIYSEKDEKNIAVVHFTGKVKPWMKKDGVKYELKLFLKKLLGMQTESDRILSSYKKIVSKFSNCEL